MKTEKKDEAVEVFAGTPWEAGIVKSLLDDAEIGCFLKDYLMGTYQPWYVAPGGAGSVKVFVTRNDFERAKSVVDVFERNQKNNDEPTSQSE